MGIYFLDFFSYLHFCAAGIAYYWGLSLKNWLIVHTIFELLENSSTGIWVIERIPPTDAPLGPMPTRGL